MLIIKHLRPKLCILVAVNKKKIIAITSITALALIGLVITQINWIRQSAHLEAAQFDHRVSMALKDVSKDISKLNVQEDRAYITSKNSKHEVEKYLKSIHLDSLLKRAFSIHKIQLRFEYSLTDNPARVCKQSEFRCILDCEGHCDVNSKYELRINFPDKSGQVYGKMLPMLILSFIVIGIGITGFIITAIALWKQKRYYDMTIDFVNNMTHELKTPISTISLASGIVRKNLHEKNENSFDQYLDMIAEENEKLTLQIERILQLAQLEKGDYRLRKHPTNIHDIISDVAKRYELKAKEKEGIIQLRLHSESPVISADPMFLKDALSNLIDNAIKYSSEKPEVTVETTSAKGHLIIRIRDNGIGMTREKQKLIFKKFYRIPTGDIHNVKGFGLGLSYVQLIVKAHQGKIMVQSEPDKGSTFEIILPI